MYYFIKLLLRFKLVSSINIYMKVKFKISKIQKFKTKEKTKGKLFGRGALSF